MQVSVWHIQIEILLTIGANLENNYSGAKLPTSLLCRGDDVHGLGV